MVFKVDRGSIHVTSNSRVKFNPGINFCFLLFVQATHNNPWLEFTHGLDTVCTKPQGRMSLVLKIHAG